MRGAFFSGSRASPRVRIGGSLCLKNINPDELGVVFSWMVSGGFSCDFCQFLHFAHLSVVFPGGHS